MLDWDLYDYVDALEAEASRRLELLRNHEWNSPPGTTEMWCIYCWNTLQQGHAEDCELAKELGDEQA